MIQAFFKHLADYMFCNQMNRESFEVHLYGIEVIIYPSINMLLIFILGILFNKVDKATYTDLALINYLNN